MKIILSYCILILLSIISNLCHAQTEVIVNRPASKNDKRYDYSHALLRKLLDVTAYKYGTAKVKQATISMNRQRSLIELQRGNNLHVMAEAVKPEWEKTLTVIRVPIRKGIQGFRLFLINQETQQKLSQVRSLEELKTFAIGSGTQWSTTRVFRENGFRVVTGDNYEGLVKMLANGRFETFSRGINEIKDEWQVHHAAFPSITIEKDLMVFIPLPTYFFVAPKLTNLSERLNLGFDIMLKDGSFDRFVYEHYEALFKEFDIKRRRVFSLKNPNLSEKSIENLKAFLYRTETAPSSDKSVKVQI